MSQNLAQLNIGGSTYSAELEKAAHSWIVAAGYFAPIQQWLFETATATAILSSVEGKSGLDRECTLTIGSPDKPREVQRVYVIGSAPADNPQRRNILLADIRFYLGFSIVVFDVNVRKRLGSTRLVGEDNPVEFVPADVVAYAPSSLNGTSAYTWDAQKAQVLAFLATPRHGRPAFTYVTDTLSLGIQPQIVQETTTDSDGIHGLARAIEALPGASIYPDLSGTLHVFDARPGAEITMVEALPAQVPDLMNHGDLVLADLAGLRPSLYRIYFDYALELRLNFLGSSVDATVPRYNPILNLDNVLQVTDQTLSIPEGPWGPARTVGCGTWITHPEAYSAYGSKSYGPYTLPILTDEIVADHWFGDALQRYTVGGGINAQDPRWAARIQEIMRTWRSYFRISPALWAQVRHIWNTRVAIIDPNTGTRAPAPVYSNYHFQTLDNFVAASLNSAIYGLDVTDSYPSDGFLQNGFPSGFRVQIEDEELGIFRIERNVLKFPGQARLAPSPVQLAATTTGGPGLNEAVLQKLVHRDSWSLSVVMTFSPAFPNDFRRLYEVQVPAADAIAATGISGFDFAQVGQCNAPDQEVRSRLAEARVAWSDTDATAQEILATFAATTFGSQPLGSEGVPGAIGPEDPVRTLVPINLKQELVPLARALAASDLIGRLDHYEGSRAIPMDATKVPLGSIHTVVHRVTKSRTVSVLVGSGQKRPVDPLDLLPAAARAFILQEIQKAR